LAAPLRLTVPFAYVEAAPESAGLGPK
jgi:hypothetical protein